MAERDVPAHAGSHQSASGSRKRWCSRACHGQGAGHYDPSARCRCGTRRGLFL